MMSILMSIQMSVSVWIDDVHLSILISVFQHFKKCIQDLKKLGGWLMTCKYS